jgi:hypothetical protein
MVLPIVIFVTMTITSLLRDIPPSAARRKLSWSPSVCSPGARLGQFAVSYFHCLHATGRNSARLVRQIDGKANEISDLKYSEAIPAR